MGKFSLTRLVMCGKYERLSSADYMRLGLCIPEQCRDCQQGVGHYVKNDTMVSIIPANHVFATSYQLDIAFKPATRPRQNSRGEVL